MHVKARARARARAHAPSSRLVIWRMPRLILLGIAAMFGVCVEGQGYGKEGGEGLLLTMAMMTMATTLPTAAQAHLSWTNILTSDISGQVDLWTLNKTGCACPHNILDHTCACCVPQGGCHCGAKYPHRCGQCGLENYCDNMCNITISSAEVSSRSGKSSGEIKSPPSISGPAFCWYKLQAQKGQRIELQIYRIKRLGRIDETSQRCLGGHLQLAPGDTHDYQPDELTICGQNERYSPPLVLFHDPPEAAVMTSVTSEVVTSEATEATLLFRVDETTSAASQFLAHYSFTPMGVGETGVQLWGGLPLTRGLDLDLDDEDVAEVGRDGLRKASSSSFSTTSCDWVFEEKNCADDADADADSSLRGCQIASPSFPGIYPPHRTCNYLIRSASASSSSSSASSARTRRKSQIRLTFSHFNLPPELCGRHNVSVYLGRTIHSPLHRTLCGFHQPDELDFVFKGQENILVQFSSGTILPPINFNGFVAKVSFSGSGSGGGRRRGHNSRRRKWRNRQPKYGGNEDEDEEEEEEEEGEDEEERKGDLAQDERDQSISTDSRDRGRRPSSGRGRGRGRSRPNNYGGIVAGGDDDEDAADGADQDQCVVEIRADDARSGRISSAGAFGGAKRRRSGSCKFIFRGNPGDVLILKLNSYRLRGKSCESSLKVFVPAQLTRHGESNVVEQICSPATKRLSESDSSRRSSNQDAAGQDADDAADDRDDAEDPAPPLLVNYSTVVLDLHSQRPNANRVEGAYKFHHVVSEGFPVPNTTCDRILPGRTGPANGVLRQPADWQQNFFRGRKNDDRVQCSTTLVPTDSQSVTVMIQTISSSSSDDDADDADDRASCETQCDSHGCRCLADGPLAGVDHLRLTETGAGGGGRVGCFCGDFAHLLPVNIITSASLVVTANFKSKRRKTQFVTSYSFHNEETCGSRRISSPVGSLESPMTMSSGQSYYPSSTYFHQHCQWFFDPPPSRQLVLEISTMQKGVDCSIWNATISIWNTDVSSHGATSSSSSPSGVGSSPYHVGRPIDRFCPEIISKEYVLNTTTRKIVISLRSLSSLPIHYRISWETRGLLSRRTSVLSAGSKELPMGGLLPTSAAAEVKVKVTAITAVVAAAAAAAQLLTAAAVAR